MIWPFKRKKHQADEYFRRKFKEPMGREAFKILYEARSIRHQYPDLSGPELVRLVYWGASGARE
jgi:hypothetical protein